MQRTPTPRHYLMCRPDFYDVTYEINPWMDATRPTDTTRAVAQWETLRQAYLGWGHTVELIDPIPGLPDMVYAANGAMVVDGIVYSAKFRYPEPVSYTHLRAHETVLDLVCRLLLEKKKK